MPPSPPRHGSPDAPVADGGAPIDAPETLDAVFARTVRQHPGAIAIEMPARDGGAPERHSYAEIDAETERLATALLPFVTGECVVAIVLPRETRHIYIAQLAVLRAGGAYTCLEPGLPPERARHVLGDARPVAVVTTPALRPDIEALGVSRDRIVEAGADATAAPQDAPRLPLWRAGANTLAYVIYTSGTTGRPKGVMIEHRSVVNLVESDRFYFRLGPGDRVGQSSSCAYDSSVEEIWLAFGCGATLVPMTDDVVRLGPDLVPWLREQRLTVFCPPPTLLRMCTCDDPARELPDLRLLYVGGEDLPADVAARWAPGRRLENGYGPTECTVTVVRTPVLAGERVTIGWPVAGNEAHVLDDALAPVKPGRPGELCIGGAGLARGYLHQPGLTAEKFVEHPRFGRLYRTGDLAVELPGGALACLGRADAQVKIRGHRVELGEIEAQLCACDGVVAAACALQGEPHAHELSAFLVTDGTRPPDLAHVRERLHETLPEHMRPLHYAIVDTLPVRDQSGKLDRSALPDIRPAARAAAAVTAPATPPPLSSPSEAAVLRAFAEHVPWRGAIGLGDDFFLALGGNSLVAAQVISTLRRDPLTASLTVRDLYETRTAAALAALARPAAAPDGASRSAAAAPAADGVPSRLASRRTWPGALAQFAFIGGSLVPSMAIAFVVVFRLLPALVRAFGAVPVMLALPPLAAAAELAWLPFALALTVAAKRALIGAYRPGRHPHLGAFHVKHWIVTHLAHNIPWALVEGTEAQVACLRALGCRIGRDVHLHHGVDLAGGGWDLLAIGDGATLGRDASLGVVAWHDRELVLAPVAIGAAATLDTRAHVAGGGSLGNGATLGALASLEAGAHVPGGERWDGVPAAPRAFSEGAPRAAAPWGAWRHACATIGARAALAWGLALPGLALAALCLRPGAHGTGLLPAPFAALPLAWAAPVAMAAYALSLPAAALLARAAGRVRPGAHPLRGGTGIALAAKDALVEYANAAVSGTLLWPAWLRAAGARIGHKCEISTVMEVVPELLEVGDECFLADGIYLGRPLLHRGVAVCAPTRLSRNTFLGNHAVVPAGAQLPPNVLFGICTFAGGEGVRAGSSWFGLPAFELPRREVAVADRALTHAPPWDRFVTRVVFESVRVALPLLPLALAWQVWRWVPAWRAESPPALFFLVVLPLAAAGMGAVLCVASLAVKWLVMGPIRAGRHELWSCWCCRWDLLFETWAGWAGPAIAAFEGTPFVAVWLRAMGCRIGRDVVFGASFLHIVDPDMLEIGDGATVSCHLQSHSFEDRVLKLAPVRIGRGANVGHGAVLLYGAEIGPRTEVADNSVVMKHETLLPGRRYTGCPTLARDEA